MSLPPEQRAPAAPVPVYLAAGSNVEPEANLVRALAELRRLFPDLVTSRAYRNAAVGFEGADFINLVVRFTTRHSLAALLEQLHAVEALCGRERGAPKYEPRRMDLDVLLYGDLVGEFPGARLPRPDLMRRAFMLGPLAELAPAVVHPTLHATIGELWARFDQAAHPLTRVALPGTDARR
ncbi:MAG: 2-amino-4-hydroxy-6-hydroxymethyldihydropteridine diphosphokinase [Proteobacteria bacterium]|nr:2-amino-4-hydroxy-6-hydroxymethyldihydropteridine diphosphokinase [Pseudomonadota bacterium]